MLKGKRIKILFLYLAFLSVSVPRLYAWYEKTHALAAKEAVELIKKLDKENEIPHYDEVYLLENFVELGRGAWREDFNPPIAGNARAFRHFFDPTAHGYKGSPFYWHFLLWRTFENEAVERPASGYYVSALVWAKNGAKIESNPFHWEGAIEIYDYTPSSKREAYYRLGHVVHLLCDMSEPDHSTNTPHPGSGKIIPDTVDSMFGASITRHLENINEDILTTETIKEGIKGAAIKTALEVFIKACYLEYGDKWQTRKERLIGFEGLIEETIKPSLVGQFFFGPEKGALLSAGFRGRGTPPIRPAMIRKTKTLDDYFTTLALRAQAARKASGLPLALGCRDIGTMLDDLVARQTYNLVKHLFSEPIYALPMIDTDNPGDQVPYFRLAWPLLREAAEYSAGLIEDFHDIVNHPPYVKAVRVSQSGKDLYTASWEDNLKEGKTGRKEERFYDVNYPEVPENYKYVEKRTLIKNVNGFLKPETGAELKIEFGPCCGETKERIGPESVKVTVDGETIQGKMEDEVIWRGAFTPKLAEGESGRDVRIEISANDLHVHFPRQGLPNQGYELDSDPETPAKCASQPPYEWKEKTYTPGADENHTIHIERDKAAEDPADDSGECPIPPGARLSDRPTQKWYWLGLRHVGPYKEWYDKERTMRKEEGCYDEDGKPKGTWKEYFRNGKVSREYSFKNGLREGSYTYFWDNGNINTQHVYRAGVRSGLYSRYSKDGSITEKGLYVNGKKEGEVIHYYKDGAISLKENYKGGGWHGNKTYFYKDGTLKERYSYVNGKRAGTYTKWYDGKQKMEEGDYEANKKTGVWKRWYKDGEPQSERPYEKGMQNGIEVHYRETGEILLEIPYVNSKQNGTMFRYHRNGKPQREVPFKDGRKEGVVKEYREDETLISEEPHKNGLPHGIAKRYNDKGELISKVEWENGKFVRILMQNGKPVTDDK